jgi:tetratricopeptide (TPR) repeat protein
MRAKILLLLAPLLLAACSRPGDDEGSGKPPREPASADLGSLTFQVTGGTPEARRHFERGLLALHSFWYDEAEASFQQAIAADRSFSMAYWGLAMSMSKLLWGEDRAREARAALNHLPRADLLTPRERAWVAAARALFASNQALANREAFARALDEIHATYPDDESATFLAVALLGTLYPGRPDQVATRERAGALAAEVFARNPKHPGAAHYLIHAYDTPELAPKALEAAQRYATIAPEAFHARHMPAHIFSRLGRWQDALVSCQAAWDASVAVGAKKQLGRDHHDYHSLSWLVEMNFELGRRSQADVAFKIFADAARAGLTHENRLAYVTQVTSYMARTGEWSRVDELLAALDGPVTDDPTAAGPASPASSPEGSSGSSCTAHAPQPAGSPMQLFERRGVLSARARAAASLRDLPRTRELVAEIAKVDEAMHPFLAASQPPELVAMQEKANQQTASALLARARGDLRALLAILQQMEATGAGPAGEGVADAFIRLEGIADTLLELGRAAEALDAYQRVVAQHPGRAHSMLGAARAAKRAGDAQASRAWYARLAEQWSGADDGTEGLAEARAAAQAP